MTVCKRQLEKAARKDPCHIGSKHHQLLEGTDQACAKARLVGKWDHGQDVEAPARIAGVMAYKPRALTNVLALRLALRAIEICQRREQRGPHVVWRKNLD